MGTADMLPTVGQWWINSLVSIELDTVQLCHRLNTLVCPNLIQQIETCLGLKKAVVTPGSSSAL